MTRVLVPLALAPAAFTARDAAVQVECLHGQTMGTSWSVKCVRPAAIPPDAIAGAAQAALNQVVAEMSHWEESSQLCRFNRAVPGEWRDLPHGFFTVLAQAMTAAEMSKGAYDPTIGPLVDLWGFGPAPARVAPPSADEIENVLAHVGWHRLTLDQTARRVRQPGNVKLDFSGIAKGYGVDQVAAALIRLGITDFLVEVGGELRGSGVKPDGQPWWVALERPPSFAGGEWQETLVALHGLSVATSGDYRRYFESGGKRYSHSIDPRTGYPVDNGMVSATVIDPSCMKADVFATVLTVLGLEEGLAFATRHGLAALLVAQTSHGLAEAMSPALAAMLD